ncbi:MAG: glycosyltransferase family 39 protein [Pirellulales bacterium]
MAGFLAKPVGFSAVFVHHIFVHIASLLILIFSAAITIQLGGKTKAVLFVLLCLLISPGFGRTQQLFQPVVFSELCWVLGFYQLIRFIKNPQHRHLLYLTLTLAFGFLTKYDIVFLIAGLVGLFFFEKTRSYLLRIATVPYMLLFLAIISPNVWWQYEHNFPMFQMF